MGYAEAFQPLLSLLGRRAEEQRQASLLESQRTAAQKQRQEERDYAAGLLRAQREYDAPVREAQLFSQGMRRYQPGMMNTDYSTSASQMRAAPGDVSGSGVIPMSLFAPAVEAVGASRGAAESAGAGGWIKSALSESEQARKDAAEARRAELQATQTFQAQQNAMQRQLQRDIAAGNQATQRTIANLTRTNRPPSEGERKAAGFLARMTDASSRLNTFEPQQNEKGEWVDATGKKLDNPKATMNQLVQTDWQKMQGMVPIVGDKWERNAQNPLQKQYLAIAADWLSAVLRKESGASITETEWADAFKRYLPTRGESLESLKEKQRNRRNAERAVGIEAGALADDGMSATPSAPSFIDPSQFWEP